MESIGLDQTPTGQKQQSEMQTPVKPQKGNSPANNNNGTNSRNSAAKQAQTE